MNKAEQEIKKTINSGMRIYRQENDISEVPLGIKWEWNYKGTKVILLGGNNFRPAIARYHGEFGNYFAKIRENFAEVIGKPYPIHPFDLR